MVDRGPCDWERVSRAIRGPGSSPSPSRTRRDERVAPPTLRVAAHTLALRVATSG
jgi:hypothetical protein